MIYTGIEQLVGHTPLYCPERLLKGKQLYGKVLCKLEMFNPAGSVKDRAGLYMILDAEEKGLLAPGGTIMNPPPATPVSGWRRPRRQEGIRSS